MTQPEYESVSVSENVTALNVPIKNGPFEPIMKALKDFNSEQRNILAYSLVAKASDMLMSAMAKPEAAGMLTSTAGNVLEFAKVTLAHETLAHEDWEAEDDPAVDEIWLAYIKAMDTVSLNRLGADEDLIERLVNGEPGEASKEDREAVRNLMQALYADTEPEKPADEDRGYGMYL